MGSRQFKPLRNKLVIFTSLALAIGLTTNTIQNVISLNSFVESETELNLLTRANMSARTIGTIFSFQKQNMANAIQIVSKEKKDQWSRVVSQLIKKNSNTVAINILRKRSANKFSSEHFEFTSRLDDPRFENRSANAIRQRLKKLNLKWAKRVGSKPGFQLRSLWSDKDFRLPLINYGMLTQRLQGKKDAFILIVTAWQTPLSNALGPMHSDSSYVVTKEGSVFSSNLVADMKPGYSFSNSPILQASNSKTSRSGFRHSYSDGRGGSFDGAYSIIPKFENYTVVVQKQSQFIGTLPIRVLVESLAWGVFVLLVVAAVTFKSSRETLVGLKEISTAAKRIAGGDFSQTIQPRSRDEIGQISLSVNQIAQQIPTLIQSSVEKFKSERDQMNAAVLENLLFPQADVRHGAISISGFHQSTKANGGDIWGQIEIEDNVSLIFIGDAMGKGMATTVISSVAYSAFMTISQLIKSKELREYQPSKILNLINKIIYDGAAGNISMTCFVLLIDLNKGLIQFSNAGQNVPILIPQSKDDPRGGKPLKTLQKISQITPINLNSKGLPLGIDRNSIYRDTEFPAQAQDKIVLFTDGLIECESPNGRAWGRKSLMESVLASAASDYGAIKDKVIEKAFKFFGSNPAKDDVTLVLIEIDKQWKASSVGFDTPSPIASSNFEMKFDSMTKENSHGVISSAFSVDSFEDSLPPSTIGTNFDPPPIETPVSLPPEPVSKTPEAIEVPPPISVPPDPIINATRVHESTPGNPLSIETMHLEDNENNETTDNLEKVKKSDPETEEGAIDGYTKIGDQTDVYTNLSTPEMKKEEQPAGPTDAVAFGDSLETVAREPFSNMSLLNKPTGDSESQTDRSLAPAGILSAANSEQSEKESSGNDDSHLPPVPKEGDSREVDKKSTPKKKKGELPKTG